MNEKKTEPFVRYVLVGKYHPERIPRKFVKYVLRINEKNPDVQMIHNFLTLPVTTKSTIYDNPKDKNFYILDIVDGVMFVTGGTKENRRRCLQFHQSLKDEFFKQNPRKRKLVKIITELQEIHDPIDESKKKIESIITIMRDNIDYMLDRGEKLETLEEDAKKLEDDVIKFKKKSRNLKVTATVSAGLAGAATGSVGGAVLGTTAGVAISAPIGGATALGIFASTGGFDMGTAGIGAGLGVSATGGVIGATTGSVGGLATGASVGSAAGGTALALIPVGKEMLDNIKIKLSDLTSEEEETEGED